MRGYSLSGKKAGIGDNSNLDSADRAESVFIAAGEYSSNREVILSGYKTYQRKYVVKRVLFRFVLVLIAAFSSIMMIITGDSIFPMILLIACIAAGWYFLTEPLGNKKKLAQSLELLEGLPYKAEIYTDKIIISTERPKEDTEDNTNIDETEKDENDNNDSNEDTPPATVIHLNYHIVDLLDKSDMFIICVKKSYVFIIPKSAFAEDEISKIRDKLAGTMGIRYKLL